MINVPSLSDIQNTLLKNTELKKRIKNASLLSDIQNSLRKKKDNIETSCNYRVRDTRNQRSIIIDCGLCEHDSSLNDDKCRRNIFSLLLAEPICDRLVLSHLYERDYTAHDLQKLYKFARLQENLGSYSIIEVCNKRCLHKEKEECIRQRYQIIESIINNSRTDPYKVYAQLADIENLIKHIEAPDRPECYDCIQMMYSILEQMYDLTYEIKEYCERTTDDKIGFDYEKNIKPHVRPSFSTSRIYMEPPENTNFLDCYDISHNDGRKLPVTLYELTDRPEKLYSITPMEYNLYHKDLEMLERVRKKLIHHRPDNMNFADPVNSREYVRRISKRLIEEDAKLYGININPLEFKNFCDLLAKYTTGLGILEDILSDSRVTDVYINAPADHNPIHVVVDGEECVTNIFLSQDDLDSMISRFRAISGRPFGEATPVLEMDLKEFGVRVSVIGDPLSASGLAYAFRKHASKPWTLPKLINTGSLTPLAAGIMSFLMDGESSVLVAGDVGAGKTSLLCALIMEIPQRYRILSIEDTRELPIEKLQQLGWKMQGMNSKSSILSANAEIAPDMALRAALRLGNSALVIGEVRGPEVKVLYEAMQVGTAGNSVLGTIHGASTKAVYERIVHTLKVPEASFRATDAVIICSSTRIGGSMTKKRKVTQIAEVVHTDADNTGSEDLFARIMHYDASIDSMRSTDLLDRGQSELINKIAYKWGISIDSASGNIRLRARIKERMAKAGLDNPGLVEADIVSRANNMFWFYMDSEKNSPQGPDYDRVYENWNRWFARLVDPEDEIHESM